MWPLQEFSHRWRWRPSLRQDSAGVQPQTAEQLGGGGLTDAGPRGSAGQGQEPQPCSQALRTRGEPGSRAWSPTGMLGVGTGYPVLLREEGT